MARLSAEARREQLLELGTEMITASSFDEFSIDELARRAGISRSLLFHYFDNRQDFVVEVARRAADEVLAVTEPTAGLSPALMLITAIEGFLDHIAKRGEQYVALVRGAAGGDAQMQAVFSDTRALLADRVLDLLEDHGAQPELVRLTVRGQIAYAEEVVTSWLVSPLRSEVTRDQVVVLLATSMVDALHRAGAPLDEETRALLASLDA